MTNAPHAQPGENSRFPGFAVVIPVFNHGATVAAVARDALTLGFPVIVVDDGSTDGTAAALRSVSGIQCLRHRRNRGKGAALLTGMTAAAKIALWAVAIDADGQHAAGDAETLIRAIPEGSRPIVVGRRRDMNADRVPWTSRFGREFSNFWVRAAGGPPIADTQSGFRIYPLPETLDLRVRARRYQYEIEVLVAARNAGIPILETPIGVHYGEGGERISHFRPAVDFFRNTATFSRLITPRVLKALFAIIVSPKPRDPAHRADDADQ